MIADRDFYSLLRQQELLLRPNRSSSQLGFHPLSHRGRSLEFSEYREYHPGEDLRDLDWKLFARTDRYYVKQRDSHTPATALLLVDDSASMQFHSKRATVSKLRTALLCAFAFAYVLHRQGDALAFRTLSQAQPTVPPRTSRRAFRHLVQSLKKADQAEPVSAVVGGPEALDLRPKSVDHLFFISDFLIPEVQQTSWLDTLQQMAFRSTCIRVLDPFEANPDDSVSHLEELEFPKANRVVGPEDWQDYRERFREHGEQWAQACKARRFAWHELSSGGEVPVAIRTLLGTPGLVPGGGRLR
ncbi:MAG TPA: DUF58 domain-containing protein [Deltaproteobacteria bacterium]|nr:DUF58 domain-containing protein [Deltaproteobacteria bacterium]